MLREFLSRKNFSRYEVLLQVGSSKMSSWMEGDLSWVLKVEQNLGMSEQSGERVSQTDT